MMRKIQLVGLVLSLAALAFHFRTTMAIARADTVVPYDVFNGPFLDPSKWLAVPTCSATPFVDTTASVNVLDCAREVQNNQLRLFVKAYGDPSSDQGRQFGPSELYFINPNAVKSLTATLTIRNIDAVACPSNSTPSFGQAIFGGNYFNPGTGNSRDDVAAVMIVQPFSPGTGLGVFALVFSPNAFYGFATLGAIKLNEPLTGNVQWDQPNHRFVFSVLGPNLNSTKTISYSATDTMPAAAPMKLLAGRAFVPNCTTLQTSAGVEVLFQSVAIN